MDFLKQRRQKFLQAIGKDGIAVIFAARDLPHHRKTISIYRQDSNFYYLTGFIEAEALAVFIPGRAAGEFILFSQEKNPQEELWNGLRIGQELARSEYGAVQAFSIAAIDEMLPQLMIGREKVYFNDITNHHNYHQVAQWIKAMPHMERKGNNKPTDLIDAGKILHAMRMLKEPREIELLRQAATITARAQKRIMQKCRPDMMEYELEAEAIHEFLKSGARLASFEPIIAGGVNGCVLHYNSNDKALRDGELVLADIGAEYEYYAGDITRTFPINGKFTREQRAVYEAVLAAQLAVINSIRPGVTWQELQKISEIAITEQLVAIGLLQGNVDELWQQQAFKSFYMHFVSHWIGMDPHDVGYYNASVGWVKLQAGMVLSVEPGIYIAPDMTSVDAKWRGIAVRIEDDILVTDGGCEVLSADVPKGVEEIEKIMINK